ncbi:MAG: hypothetical protein A2X94_09040 [Bdellovibrionales bacterium GWB1_55_8]|nr:MAG: hypothetical protein A2X94_09040 [Bdellovibrionales bacterium GWB1_55_8]
MRTILFSVAFLIGSLSTACRQVNIAHRLEVGAHDSETTALPKPTPPPAGKKLLHSADLTYLGAFLVPKQDMGGPQYQGLSYGGSAIAYNPVNHSLFIVGHDNNQQVAEISIPAPVNSSTLSDLNTATVIQNLVDITEGNRLNLKTDGGPIEVNGVKIGGLLKYGDKLIGSAYAYYDAGHQAVRSHFRSGLNLATAGDFEGMFELGSKPTPVPQAGFIGGYMTAIPSNWQAELGGKVLTGMSALSILGRTSSGPAAFAFDPDQLGPMPAPVSALLYYPIDHQTIGTYYSSQTLYNKGSHHSGVVFPSGTATILYTGKHGLGEACYGPGTDIQAEHGNRYNSPPPDNTCRGIAMTNTADPCCYDPVNFNKGAHAYPYVDFVWAYDAADLARVKAAGRIVDDPSPNLVDSALPSSTESYKPWHIKPYATWTLTYPTIQEGYGLSSGASAYDDENRTLYTVQVMTDNYSLPVIHMFRISTGE